MSIRYEMPGHVKSASNLREHHMARAKRVKAERDRSYRYALAAGVKQLGPLLVVTLTRRSPRLLDAPNLGAALKAQIDGLASALRIDDGSHLVEWVLAQEKGEPAVLVEIALASEWRAVQRRFPDVPFEPGAGERKERFMREMNQRNGNYGPLPDDVESDVVEQMESSEPEQVPARRKP